MPGIRTLTLDWDHTHVKTYVSKDRAAAAAKELADRLIGCVNVTILPVVTWPEDSAQEHATVRYTAVFSCFSEESDVFAMAHMQRGSKGFTIHR
jgi:hypothetical protein